MNRNMMYDYLKSIGMYPVIHRRKVGYHVEFRKDYRKNQTIEGIILDWGYVRGFDSIHLCRDEIVLEALDSKINIKYKSIEKFEVIIYEDEDE